ncbi:hypothetical protein [Hymenobacter sp. GOD-10R]|uniref:hypothetical protein n=1 Tax=Hymenobacter sp. GOD-10R TaxID=3093922 RepID=UPI002D765BFF|nr:hypothetical protein [Hymenobacter sp. GOD-10R]WRQ31798.1 hypothetical protein SD425_28535 [Hymenobacter sp. GOD-10R]
MKLLPFGLSLLLTAAVTNFACGQTKMATTATKTMAAAKQISAQDQKEIKQLVGDKYDVSFANGSAVISEKASNLSRVKVSNGKTVGGNGVGAVAIITVDVVINKNAKAGIDNLSQRLDKQSVQRLQSIMMKYQ